MAEERKNVSTIINSFIIKKGYGTGVLSKHYEKKHAKDHSLLSQQAQILAYSGTLST